MARKTKKGWMMPVTREQFCSTKPVPLDSMLVPGEKLKAFDIRNERVKGDFTVETVGPDWVQVKDEAGNIHSVSVAGWAREHIHLIPGMVLRWINGGSVPQSYYQTGANTGNHSES